MIDLYVIPCGAQKLDRPAPARDLYTSPIFRSALATAEALEDEDHHFGAQSDVLILSALHGLVDPDAVLDPYDLRMGAPGSITVEALAEQLAAALGAPSFEALPWCDLPDARVTSFLPRAYRVALARAAELVNDAADADAVTIHDVYEAAPGIGYQCGVLASLARH